MLALSSLDTGERVEVRVMRPSLILALQYIGSGERNNVRVRCMRLSVICVVVCRC